MESYRMVGGKFLRRGYTTGSCAAAAAKAAAIMLLKQENCDSIVLTTPKGITLTLDVCDAKYMLEVASCAVQKDSGDDPDITNGVFVYAEVSRTDSGIKICGGKGVGRVTKPGLNQPMGEYAINSMPRKMIADECENICRETGYAGGLSVVISIPNGEELALKTFNLRMGIEGGLSILGTTGIVEPMSEDALVDTIKTELDVIYASGSRKILLIIGNYGEAFARDILRVSLESHIKCSNYIGDTLSAAAERGFKRALLVGHIGKLVKLGIGIMNTHSNHGDGRMETLIACALEAGGDLPMLHNLRECVSTDHAITLLKEAKLYGETMKLLCARIEDTLRRNVAPELEIGFVCFSGMGESAEICMESSIAEKIRKDFER